MGHEDFYQAKLTIRLILIVILMLVFVYEEFSKLRMRMTMRKRMIHPINPFHKNHPYAATSATPARRGNRPKTATKNKWTSVVASRSSIPV